MEEIEGIKQQIAKEEAKITKLEEDIAAAEGEWRKGGSDKEHWQKTVQQLRDEKGQLLQEKGRLRQEALLLRASLPACDQAPAPVVSREQVARELHKRLPSPSSYAKNTVTNGWPDPQHKALLKLLRTHRPAVLPNEDFDQMPVGLLSPILGQVEEDCAYSDPTAEDTDFSVELGEAMSEKFQDEDSRKNKFCEMLSQKYGIPFQRIKIRNSETDGTALIGIWGVHAMAVNLEAKLEVGSGGGDPRIRNATYAGLHVSETYLNLGRFSCCPVLLIELAGPNIGLSGFAFGEYACCDQLSQMVSLLRQPKSEIAIGAPRVLLAIRKAWPSLKEYYAQLAAKPTAAMLTEQLSFPYPKSYEELGGDTDRAFRYIRRLSDFTFLAESTGTTLFVKFCKRYSMEAHQVLEKAGYAPCLLGLQKLPGRWLMVVMEYLESAVLWSDSMFKPTGHLAAAVKAMHDAGYVHGDLRSPNVLVQNEKVYLVDFEWAGKEGSVTYPLFMNRATETWPEGAVDGERILRKHDLEWQKRLVDLA